ncbi:accessory gene regulator B family protein [Clostridium beijerinckii]|jgi:accessory gene regulator B|uniref:Accessory gene regulator B family protein n=2 Tax=Clostridium beijerinckii TaxID=1520 RepID=A0AAE2V1K2_CLOBE|nr:accessory gene regulator B family protein [Clostridium beijerinckii]ABR32458.1 Accessory gene regulator B [Clostridium beijerinckii NCIMB 8052]AIU01699.1 accessory gene regulator B [Clostridium beijerinckii ATCC 35702]MBF7807866.1 accessory gene regulator B family protein [Clostridium beijerinckii]NRT26317.1 accessory gene regulator B [Clostridium beijerinckii]NRT66076.1 accessory gene regulator B [Clostridium beijerinckii]
MIASIANFLTEYLNKNNSSLSKNDVLKIQYSLQIILGDLTKSLVILSIFLFVGQLPLFFLIFIILNSTRPLMGGIHCKTFKSCLVFSIMYFLIILLFSIFSSGLNTYFSVFFFIISFIITFINAPCCNEKRPIKNKKILKILSLISLTFWCMLFFILRNTQLCNCIFLSLLIQITQLIIVNMKGVISNAKINENFFNFTN